MLVYSLTWQCMLLEVGVLLAPIGACVSIVSLPTF